jgi:predicted ATP-grasp superfamily ATP-dependent carboligase
MAATAPHAEGALFLIAAISGRALAASARRGRFRPVVLDCFADRDTRALAGTWRAVPAANTLQFDRRALLEAANALAPGAPLLPGSGFEGRPALLARLAAGRELLGNPPEVVRAVKDPWRLFPQFDALGIPHPEVRQDLPAEPGGWLVKRAGGAGGTHIRAAGAGPRRAGDYFQRLEPGLPMSALFLADGRRALILGFNQQWAGAGRAGLPYLFGGAVSRVSLPGRLARHIAGRVDALVAATGLVGLNGLDFLLEGERWSALEINPRPTATMELYDADYELGLVHQHIEAARRALPRVARPGPSRAQLVLHARSAWQVEPTFDFPAWCCDIPNPHTAIRPGDPVCTVLAEGAYPVEARNLVEERGRQLERMIWR